jgi:hypothetical protein
MGADKNNTNPYCRVCGDSNFVEIKKKQTSSEQRRDQRTSISVCKSCDPLLASMALLSDGFVVASKLLSHNISAKTE